MSDNIKVAFVICTYNRANYLDQTLKTLIGQFNFSDLKLELIVVDNNSQDQTPKVVHKYQKINKSDNSIKYVKETTQGLTYARNRGIMESNATYIVFLDDDIRASDSFIRAWISFFLTHPEALAAGGRMHVRFDKTKPKWVSYFLLPLFGRHDLGKSLKKYPFDRYPFGGNMGFKRSVFEKVGNFNTKLGKKGKSIYAKGEEKELFRRIRSVSNSIYYIPDAFLYHHVDGSRLTETYVKEQAIGIGRGMNLEVDHYPLSRKIKRLLYEIVKLLASIVIGLYYLIRMEPSKTSMLFKFRIWIWEGFFQSYR